MERRMWLGIALLSVFLFSGIYTSVVTENICAPISDILQESCDYACAGELETAAELTLQASKLWKENWNKLAIVADHSPMDEIDGLFSQANMYAKTGALQDLSASCARLAQLVDAISDAHNLTWWNII